MIRPDQHPLEEDSTAGAAASARRPASASTPRPRVDVDFRCVPDRPRDIEWGLHVCGAGRARLARGVVYPPPGFPDLYQFEWAKGRTLPEYQIVYLPDGEGEFESAETGRRTLAAGTAILLFPGVWHRYRPARAAAWEEYWVSFRGDQMDRLVRHGFFSPHRPLLSAGLHAAIVAPFQRLFTRLCDTPPGYSHLVAVDVLEILAATLALAGAGGTDGAEELGDRGMVRDRIVADALRMIWSESHTDLTAATLARRLGMSLRSLERRFREVIGGTVRDEIMQCRLGRARRLLADTELSVAEVVTAAGFSSADSFNRAVQRAEGMTPSELREWLRAGPLDGASRVANVSKNAASVSREVLVRDAVACHSKPSDLARDPRPVRDRR